jgi:Cu(I)/Ag(I) efflux system membrane fusion protein
VPIPAERLAPPPAVHPAADADADAAAALPPPEGVQPVTVTTERQQAVGIVTAAVTRRALPLLLRESAVVEVAEESIAQLHARAPGFLERVDVRQTGVRVSRGQTLAWIYSPEVYQAEEEFLAASRWSAGAADATAAARTGMGPDVAVAARRRLELLGFNEADFAGLLRAGVAQRRVPLRAPAAGTVVRFGAPLGLYATPETVLYEIADLSTIRVVANVPERDLGLIRRDTAARFWVPGQTGEPLAARVALIEPEIAATTRAGRVRLTVPNPGLRLVPGQFGDVEFVLPGRDALTVDRDAVIDVGTRQYVYVATGGGRFEPRAVTVGARFDDRVQILAGVVEGERVVTRGGFMLDSESRLQTSLAIAPVASDASVDR